MKSTKAIKRTLMVGEKNPAFVHGHSLKSGQSAEYMIWSQMIQRCKNPRNKAYKNYGGRGVRVCPRWKNFKGFLDDMGLRPAANLTLERIETSAGYCPSNCKWATRAEQSRNRRNTLWFTVYGTTKCLKDWARHFNLGYRMLHKRIAKGWSFERATSTR